MDCKIWQRPPSATVLHVIFTGWNKKKKAPFDYTLEMKTDDKEIKAFILRSLMIPHFSSHLLLTHKYYNSKSLNTLPKKKQTSFTY